MQIKLMLVVLLFMLPSVHAGDDDAGRVSEIGKAIEEGISDLIRGFFGLVEDYILEPGMRIFRNTLGGVADAFGNVISGTFAGVTGYMNSAWRTSSDAISGIPYIGPLAPVLSFAVLGGVVFMFWFLFVDKILDALFPIPGESDMED